jgi:hypothetical protein
MTSVSASAAWDEETGKSEVEKLGGKLKYGEGKYAKNVVAVDLSNSRVTDGDLRHLLHFRELQHLDVRGTSIGDPGTQYPAFIKNLRTLKVSGTQMTDAGLERLKKLKNLEIFLVDETKITQEAARRALSKVRFTA